MKIVINTKETEKYMNEIFKEFILSLKDILNKNEKKIIEISNENGCKQR